jgi:hypothetical protein
MAENICVGTLTTRSFSFMGIAKNESAMRIMFSKAWKLHCNQTDMPYNWAEWKDDLKIQWIKSGEVSRDGSIFYHE